MTTKTTRTYQVTCVWCAEPFEITSTRKPPALMGCDKPECIAAHNANVREQYANRAPRRPRRKAVTGGGPGDWSAAAMLGSGMRKS